MTPAEELMAAERMSMRTIREVLRLAVAGQSQRVIAESVLVARSTVREYLQRAATAGLSWQLPDSADPFGSARFGPWIQASRRST